MVPIVAQLGSIALVAFVVSGWFWPRREQAPAEAVEAQPVPWWRESA